MTYSANGIELLESSEGDIGEVFEGAVDDGLGMESEKMNNHYAL
jgi:hypothetical protein